VITRVFFEIHFKGVSKEAMASKLSSVELEVLPYSVSDLNSQASDPNTIMCVAILPADDIRLVAGRMNSLYRINGIKQINIAHVPDRELATQVPDDQLINFLRDANVDYDTSTNEFKIKDDYNMVTFPLTKDNLITEKFDDLFYIRLKNEINIGYKFGLYSSLVVLSRKLIENLLIEILRRKYPRNKKGNLEFYYEAKRRRFHDFIALLDNLEKQKSTFGIDEPTVSKFISLVKPFRESANSTAHSMIQACNKEEVIKYKIPEMIALLTRLLKHLH
jgi:hypothetical protein